MVPWPAVAVGDLVLERARGVRRVPRYVNETTSPGHIRAGCQHPERNTAAACGQLWSVEIMNTQLTAVGKVPTLGRTASPGEGLLATEKEQG